MATYTYHPPTRVELPQGADFYKRSFPDTTRGISVIREAGTWTQVENPTSTRIAAAQSFYQGGHVHSGVSEATKTEIEGDGAGGTFVAE